MLPNWPCQLSEGGKAGACQLGSYSQPGGLSRGQCHQGGGGAAPPFLLPLDTVLVTGLGTLRPDIQFNLRVLGYVSQGMSVTHRANKARWGAARR